MSDPVFDLQFPYAHGAPTATADFRSSAEDFVVEENLGFELAGEGEHLCLHVQKTGENTAWVADRLASAFSVRPMDVSYCGLKDRHAVTSQWFSVYLPKPPENERHIVEQYLSGLDARVQLLAQCRHTKKLRRGDHQSNRFRIVLRNLQLTGELEAQLHRLASQGVPNYFGEQRFGNHGGNLLWAHRWMTLGEKIRSRNKRKMALSAARSWLFNRVLAQRVKDGTWAQPLFDEAPSGPPSGPLWGRGRAPVAEPLAAFEQQLLGEWHDWQNVLEHAGLSQERRALVLVPQHFSWQLTGSSLQLSFSLPPGAYATAVLRELCHLNNLAGSNNDG